jgi:hypothetical protein
MQKTVPAWGVPAARKPLGPMTHRPPRGASTMVIVGALPEPTALHAFTLLPAGQRLVVRRSEASPKCRDAQPLRQAPGRLGRRGDRDRIPDQRKESQ